ncbi:uncharacterized protein BO80DRAFT_436215 [Aspergillus ibericus CBS 121593]|uniref:Uncharacterized protein n=1 Tax=Aspergillus ibericus CBS 121593 TaxID=1448316 RepID=A0A395GW58_9EURO|nr:hypothetical protein BO80DRAFT_436215 [Aspergillus ibericus CBS 121593]RAK99334.1 hypothetical protein BO80DRAFT_436215 [Aspergillus ibericus CBS 121593]
MAYLKRWVQSSTLYSHFGRGVRKVSSTRLKLLRPAVGDNNAAGSRIIPARNHDSSIGVRIDRGMQVDKRVKIYVQPNKNADNRTIKDLANKNSHQNLAEAWVDIEDPIEDSTITVHELPPANLCVYERHIISPSKFSIDVLYVFKIIEDFTWSGEEQEHAMHTIAHKIDVYATLSLPPASNAAMVSFMVFLLSQTQPQVWLLLHLVMEDAGDAIALSLLYEGFRVSSIISTYSNHLQPDTTYTARGGSVIGENRSNVIAAEDEILWNRLRLKF